MSNVKEMLTRSHTKTLVGFIANNHLNYLPLRKTLKGYGKESFKGDLNAGLNVALLAFPQGMAYAMIAGLPIQYGIYGSAVATILGMFFAGSRFIVLGPTNATSVILFTSFASMGVSTGEKMVLLPMLLLMVGVILMVGAYFKLANLIQFISRTVVTGYITAAALLIIANQIKNALGITFDPTESANTFFEVLFLSVKKIPQFDSSTVTISAITLIIFLIIGKKFKTLPNVAVTLIVVSIIYAFLSETGSFHVATLDSIATSGWLVTMPVFEMAQINQLGGAAIAIALLCVLEGTSIGKSLAARTGSRIDPNQEMFSIGMANVGCSFFSGMAASGSLTRSVLNWSSGAKTPLASYFSGIICVVGAVLLGPYLTYVPKSALAILVIFIGISLINMKQIRVVTKSTKSDACVFYMSLFCGLCFSLTAAIYIGAGLSIILFLKKVATPELVEYSFNEEGQLTEMDESDKRPDPEISIVHVEGELFFAAAELFNEQMRRVCEDENLKILVLKMRNAHNLDATSVMAFQELIHYMHEKNREVLICELRKDTLKIFKNSGLLDSIDERNRFLDEPSNLTLSTAKALKRAKEIIGGSEAKITIFADQVRKSIENK
tara:strand:+ start:285 stop:2108 length:1824 start_codon:yes stop_codon:yes gene_type:complete